MDAKSKANSLSEKDEDSEDVLGDEDYGRTIAAQ